MVLPRFLFLPYRVFVVMRLRLDMAKLLPVSCCLAAYLRLRTKKYVLLYISFCWFFTDLFLVDPKIATFTLGEPG